MARSAHADVLDGSLLVIKNSANQMTLCSQAPTTRTEAVTTYMLASVAMASGDFTIGAGTGTNRKCTVAAKNGIASSNSGNGNHLALVDGTRLLYVTEISNAQQVTAPNPVDLAAWEIEQKQPVAPV